MQSLLQKIFRPRVGYEPLIEVRIFQDAILNNLKKFQSQYPKFLFAPVLKSNAYGHGLVLVGKILDKENLPFFMVDSFFEGLQLRRGGVTTKILILGYNRLEQTLHNKLKNCSFGIIDFVQLKLITEKLKKPQTFHLKIDTGMHRQGIGPELVGEAIKLIKNNPNFLLEGLCSHFADSDGQGQNFTLNQIGEWNKIVEVFKKEFPSIKYFHTSNTAGTFYADKINQNVGRLGLGLYGMDLSIFQKLNLEPALEMVSVISSIKNIKAGEMVGYGGTFLVPKDMVVATVPVGYNEGVDRRLSNVGSFKVGNVDCPIVGRVSMNMCSIDVSEIRNQKLEQEVVVISKNLKDKNSVENIAKLCGTISHEILVKIPSNLRRIVV